MTYGPRLLTLVAFGVLACGPQVAIDDDTGDDTEGTGTVGADDGSVPGTSGSVPPSATTGMGPTTASPVTSADSVGEVDVDDADSIGFIPDPDTCGVDAPEGTSFHCSYECDPFLQDCPQGEKCMPWANDGGTVWNAYRCSPVDADPGQAGEPCLVEGSGVSGIDDCDVGLMCFWVDPDTNAGTCLPLCSGSPDDPICPDDGVCSLSDASALAICLATCDPIASDCATGVCLPSNDAFVCAGGDPGTTPPGQGCEFVNECVPGSACLDGSVVMDCEASGCCSSFCDLLAAEPDAPCLMGQVCTPWWREGQAPDEWAHVGACVVPQ